MDEPYKTDPDQLAPAAAEAGSVPAREPLNGDGGPAPAGLEPLPVEQPSREEGSRPKTAAQTGWMASLQSLAVTVVIAVFVITFIVQAFQIPSESMENTLLIGDYLLVDKVHYASGGVWGHILPYSRIRRGDIIVFRFPVHPEQHFVKRVIGLPGDRIHLVNRKVYVNDQPLDEKYVIYKSPMSDIYRDDFPALDYLSGNVEARWWLEMRQVVKNGELIVPAHRYFVMGDNRDESLDSRYWGFVPEVNVIGRPLVIYWSFRRDDDPDDPPKANGKLNQLEALFVRLYHDTRWDRTLRLIR